MILRIGGITSDIKELTGNKALCLDRAARAGFPVPEGIVLPGSWYARFVREGGLLEWLLMALARRPADSLRWEEIWDLALSIRHRFVSSPVPEDLREELFSALSAFGDKPLAIRSSSPHEDGAAASHAGLHDSFVNVRGCASAMEAVREVWASLWSDRALTYNRKQVPDPGATSMAVIIQEFVPGERSGVIFTRSPMDRSVAVLETVADWNEDLVSGKKEPDRLEIDRADGAIIRYSPAGSAQKAAPSKAPPEMADLTRRVWGLALGMEKLFGAAQDVEWTQGSGHLYLLQSRPITSLTEPEDERYQYRTLRPGLTELLELRKEIEEKLLPAMDRQARVFRETDLQALNDDELEVQIERRKKALEEFQIIYNTKFIPMAHGVRLFGEIYNHTVRPESPFEFIGALEGSGFESLKRNNLLSRAIEMAAGDADLRGRLEQYVNGDTGTLPQEIEEVLAEFLERYGDSAFGEEQVFTDSASVVALILKGAGQWKAGPAGVASAARGAGSSAGPSPMEDKFLKTRQTLGKKDGPLLLDLARASYRLRDDDNLYIGKIRAEYLRAAAEKNRRMGASANLPPEAKPAAPVAAAGKYELSANPVSDFEDVRARTRQITGTPTSSGIASGAARVIRGRQDLFDFLPGEVLVCDAVDPAITFILPMAAAVVERRGGMLIHGAIIAREYKIPCVTGVRNAADLIKTGNPVLVDGYLGLVVVTDVQ